MIWVISIVGVIVAIVAVVAVVGFMLPQGHVVSRSVTLNQPPQVIFDTITDWRSFPSWREGVKSVKERSGEAGRSSWIEVVGVGEIPMEVMESDSPKKLVAKIADPNLPFGGTWTYDIQPTSGGGSTLTITENGEVYNPIFRFMSKFIFGHTATMDDYLRSIKRKFGG